MLFTYRKQTSLLTAWTILVMAALSPSSADAAKEIILGNLQNRQHDIGGEVVALSERVLEVSEELREKDY